MYQQVQLSQILSKHQFVPCSENELVLSTNYEISCNTGFWVFEFCSYFECETFHCLWSWLCHRAKNEISISPAYMKFEISLIVFTNPIEDRAKYWICMTFGSILYRIGGEHSMKSQISCKQERQGISFFALCVMPCRGTTCTYIQANICKCGSLLFQSCCNFFPQSIKHSNPCTPMYTLQKHTYNWDRQEVSQLRYCIIGMFTLYNCFVTYKLVTLVAFQGFMVSAMYNYITTSGRKLVRGHMLHNV